MDEKRGKKDGSFDGFLVSLEKQLEAYKQSLDKSANGKEFFPSDRKKMLSLPFYLAKRVELPAPKKGQKEWDLFREIYGKPWDHYDGLRYDKEEKITEFNFEEYIDEHLLEGIDYDSEEFKLIIKRLNYNSRTQYERHLD